MRIENVKPLIGGIANVDKEHLCDDDVQACRDALVHRGVLGLGGPLAVQLQ